MVRLLDLQLIYGVAGAREQFERLCLQLIQSVFPTAKGVRPDPGDGGIDIFIGDWDAPEGIHVFQVKYFPNGIKESQKQQIRASFRQCLTTTTVSIRQWTLCLPLELSQEETAWFSRWKQEVATATLPAEHITWWGESDLMRLLLQPSNEKIKEHFFREEYVTQLRQMQGTLSQLVNELYTSPAEALNAFALRQDSKEAVLRYKEEIYQPLHTEIRAILVAFENARGAQGPYPHWIPVTGKPIPRRFRHIAPSSMKLVFHIWPANKNEFRMFGALTSSARQSLDDLADLIIDYNLVVESSREVMIPILTRHIAVGLERAVQDPAYKEWKAAYKDALTPPSYQPYPWFELLFWNTVPEAGLRGEAMAKWWLGYGFQTLGWFFANNPDQAAEQLYDDYERSGAMPQSEIWFQEVCQAVCSNLTGEVFYQRFIEMQERLFALLSRCEAMLLRVLVAIQYRYEGGPPPL